MCFSPALGGKKSCQVEVSKNKSRCSYFVNQRFEKISSLQGQFGVCKTQLLGTSSLDKQTQAVVFPAFVTKVHAAMFSFVCQ